MGVNDLIPVDSNQEEKKEKYKSEKWLREQYIDEDRSQEDMARECGVVGETIKRWRDKFNIYKGRKCPLCDHQSEQLGSHFIYADHGYPEIDRRKKEILTGHVMGDAYYNRGALAWRMTNLDYMKWLKKQLGWLCSDPSLSQTPEEIAEQNFLKEVNQPSYVKRDKYMMSCDPDNYKTVYSSRTVSHRWIDKLDWLNDDGKKEFPETLNLTPTMVKAWYCDDGNLLWSRNARPNACITASSQTDILDLLADKFEEVVCRPSVSKTKLRFNVDETEEFIDWIGDSPDGMEYKFCLESKKKYKDLKP